MIHFKLTLLSVEFLEIFLEEIVRYDILLTFIILQYSHSSSIKWNIEYRYVIHWYSFFNGNVFILFRISRIELLVAI